VRVQTVVLTPSERDVTYSGTIQARVQADLACRVGGKIVARKVDVGTVVKRGQALMQLDPQDLQLAQAQASAGLKAAESNRDLAQAELKRYQDLRDRNFVSQAVLDAKQTAYKSAQASFEQARASHRNQLNQTSYSVLVADVDGVVTSVDAEVGQVVAAGNPVVRVAQSGEKEIAISIPEDKVDTLRKISDVRVRIWANPNSALPGKLRELSPIADPATRTYSAKIALPNAPSDVRLGMSAYVAFVGKTAQHVIKVPLTALFKDNNGTAVWVVENGTVRLAPVQIAAVAGNDLLIGAGVAPGQTIVTAGANLIKAGQKGTILWEDSPPSPGAKVAGARPDPSPASIDPMASVGAGAIK
jgi:RND family efflux transporter MFP subunit